MKELLITGAWRWGEQQRQAVNMDTQRFEAVICGG